MKTNMNSKKDKTRQPETCFECDAPVRTEWHHHTFRYGADDSAVDLTVRIPVEVCGTCGFASTGHKAEKLRHEAVCAHLGVLTPREIRAIRKRHRLSRAAFAELTGLGEATLHRWENGILTQKRANDNYLRLLQSADNYWTLRQLGVKAGQDTTSRQPTFRALVDVTPIRELQAAFQLRPQAA